MIVFLQICHGVRLAKRYLTASATQDQIHRLILEVHNSTKILYLLG